jgi:hypothetical protein
VCGIYSFIDGYVPEEGQYIYINIACLDNVTPEYLSQLKINFVDGRKDTWAPLPVEQTKHM